MEFKIHPGENPNLVRMQALIEERDLDRRLGGQLVFKGRRNPELTVEGPITADTPVDFGGDVVIQGDVNEGATVRVAGNLEIRGAVHGGAVRAGGSISVRKGVRHAHLEAIARIHAASAESSSLHCEGDLVVRGDLKFCSTEVGGLARVGGRVIGGHLVADQGVRALSIGNRTGIRTQVMVVPEARRQTRITRIESEIARDNARLAVYHGTSGRISNLTGEGAISARLYLAERERRYAREAQEYLEELIALRAHRVQTPRNAIAVDQGIYPGVEIQIDLATLPVDRLLPPGRFGERFGQIVSLGEAS